MRLLKQWILGCLLVLFSVCFNHSVSAAPPVMEWTDRTASIPLSRVIASMGYDPTGNQIIVFGGSNNGQLIDDTWSYDLISGTWTQLSPIVSPSARSFASMAYDAVNGKFILFGGQDDNGYLNDTWSYDAATNTWTNLSPAAPPFSSLWCFHGV